MTRYVLYSEECGVYLGGCMGFGFWSKMDAAGQPAAVTFENEAGRDKLVAQCDKPEDFPAHRLVPVEMPEGEYYATIAECVAAGLPAWEADAEAVAANERDRLRRRRA